jgi:signal transduction histidine kinase
MVDAADRKLSRPPRSDVLLAIALCAAVELEVALEGLGPATALAAAIASLAFAFRRRAPLLTLLVVVFVLVLDEPLGDVWTEETNSGVVLLLLASYFLGAHAPRRTSQIGAALAVALLLVEEFVEQGTDYLFLLWIVGMPWLAGRAVRRYRQQAARLEELAERLLDERATAAQLAVAEERQQMTAELHDALGHAVSVMVVQAGAAEEMLSENPERARPALTAVQQTGRDVMADLRAMLGILRAPPAHDRPPLPQEPISPPGWARWRRLGWSGHADAVLAVLALAVGEAFVLFDPNIAGVRVPVGLVQLCAAGAIALRSRLPTAALALALAAMTVESILIGSDPATPTSLVAALLAQYSVAAHASARQAGLAGAAGVAVPCVLELSVSNGDLADLWVIVPLFAVPWLAGRAVRASRRQAERLRVLTERLRRERDARVRLALIDERTRVARELHDSIAHAVSVMVLQAGAAEAVIESAPERARAAMQAIQEVGRRALDELQRMLTVLATDDQPSALGPRVGLAQLDTLIAQLRGTGLRVQLEVNGVPETLPVGIDISAYRIIQEALTNALKHAGPVPTTVILNYGDHDLVLEVVDDGRGDSTRTPELAGGGHGLIGMRERVALYGGTLEAGPRTDGGYAVRARLKLEHAAA